MSDLDARFATAAEDVKELPERPDNATLLKLYALYKQGSAGDVSGNRPGMMAFVDRAKYDAWAELAGTSQDDAKQAYVDLVEGLKAG
jgi:acyl-CoA-binding protein